MKEYLKKLAKIGWTKSEFMNEKYWDEITNKFIYLQETDKILKIVQDNIMPNGYIPFKTYLLSLNIEKGNSFLTPGVWNLSNEEFKRKALEGIIHLRYLINRKD